jgi:capsular exopolysaccharide synthesis family protein
MAIEPISEGYVSRPGPTLDEALAVLWRQRWILLPVFVAALLLGLLAVSRLRPVYQTFGKMVVPPDPPSVNVVDAANPMAVLAAVSQPDNLATQIQVLESRQMIEEAGQRAGVAVPLASGPEVDARALPDSTVVQITVEGREPDAIARLANALMEIHAERTAGTQSTGLAHTLGFVQQAQATAARDLAAAEERLTSFRRDFPIERITARWRAQAREEAEAQSRLRKIESDLAMAQAKIAELEVALAKEPADLVHAGQRPNPRREKMEEQFAELRFRRLDLLREFRPTSRQVRDLDSQLAGLSRQIAAEPVMLSAPTYVPNQNRMQLRSRLLSLRADARGYVAERRALLPRLQRKPPVAANPGAWEVRQSRLTYERDAAQRALATWNERLRDLQTRATQHGRSVRIIEPAAVPLDPIRPRRTKYFAYCVAFALGLAIGAAFLREYRDDRMHTPVHVERASGLPTLGQIPVLAGGSPPLLVTALPTQSRLGEAYRSLRLSIGFDEADNPVRRLMVTSPAEDEGKTTTAINLATALAVDGKRVILVDADLRRPSVGNRLDLPPSPGLTEVIQGISSVDGALHETGIENLKVMTAGELPANPAALLSSAAFESVVAKLTERAQVVLFDTPPCVPVTDPLFVAARTDGVLLVAQVAKTRRETMRCAVELLWRARAAILGVVVSGVRDGRDPYYYRYSSAYEASLAAGRNGSAGRNGAHEPTPLSDVRLLTGESSQTKES